MSTQAVENILHEAEQRLSFSEQLTLIQRLLDGMKKTSQTPEQASDVNVREQLKHILAKPARRKLHSLELDTRGFQFSRDEANER